LTCPWETLVAAKVDRTRQRIVLQLSHGERKTEKGNMGSVVSERVRKKRIVERIRKTRALEEEGRHARWNKA